jgi:hypothetical protein
VGEVVGEVDMEDRGLDGTGGASRFFNGGFCIIMREIDGT